jgi:hypothetical protein
VASEREVKGEADSQAGSRGAGEGAGDRQMSRKFMLAACTAAVAASHAVAFQPCPASALRAQRHVALRPSTSQACAAGGRIRAQVPRVVRRSAAARYPGTAVPDAASAGAARPSGPESFRFCTLTATVCCATAV